MATSFLRVRALPINDEVRDFVESHDRVYVFELNRDGQLHAILQTEMPDLATRLHSLAYMDGMPLTARTRWWTSSRPPRRRNQWVAATFRTGESDWPDQADYKAAPTTLCQGCGHNSISSQIIQVAYELSIKPHEIIKLSGIGCSSKSPTYFLGPLPRLQLAPRAHALDRHRRLDRQPQPARPGRQR